MSSKIRESNVVRYRHVPAEPRTSASNIMSQSMPMAAMFLRNKAIAWSSFFLAIQAYLNEPKNKPAVSSDTTAQQPAFFQIIFAVIALGTCYIDILFPTAPLAKAAQAVTN